ncbi:MAG: outer membrane protein assembly factor BamD [Ignavibacteriales bacterium]|nr:outer membrane protein assembly factor BamD [Ignavibacteriales bacterium]
MINKFNIVLLLTFAIYASLLLSACSSSNALKQITAEERFEMGKKLFDDEDYLEAIKEFEIVKIQFPGSTVADDAQYYLAETRFKMEEYLLAAEEYQELRRNMSASNFVPKAQFKIALCYFNLSPKSGLDQQYTYRAIDEFQTFMEYYPTDELVKEAAEDIKILNTKLAKKLFDTAELYMNMEYYKSATFYYNSIIEKYHDTQYAEYSYIGKARSLIARSKYTEARQVIDKYYDKFPSGSLMQTVDELKSKIDEEIKSVKNTGIKS